MDTNYIVGRLQTPADKDGKRTDIHLMTSVDCVMVPESLGGSGGGSSTNPMMSLDQKLNQLSIQTGSGKPSYKCLWAREKRTEPVIEEITM